MVASDGYVMLCDSFKTVDFLEWTLSFDHTEQRERLGVELVDGFFGKDDAIFVGVKELAGAEVHAGESDGDIRLSFASFDALDRVGGEGFDPEWEFGQDGTVADAAVDDDARPLVFDGELSKLIT
jgi:hypothetical protein